jgi:DNA invertase Pin-like site-specific DNA recombinase
MTSAAIYARVSSARQKKDETIRSQTAALRAHAEQLGIEVPDDWVFEDEGHSGATLVRPALERLRDLVAGVGIEVVLCYSPDRLARKFAYQALLIEEFTRAGTRVEFVKGPRGDSAEDQLLVQFQGMFAEYEKAQILERYRSQLADRDAYLALAGDLEGFLTQLRTKAEVSTVEERQRVLRLLVKDVLVGPEKITIRHRIPIRERTGGDTSDAGSADMEGECCPLRWGRNLAVVGQHLPARARHRTHSTQRG